ncbi:hypothetical protein CPB85DRAFT_1267539 [Mucidula mucida]|nr:hypothetical protein CPB85DRAFT_1267539 [Mucidula mucida]
MTTAAPARPATRRVPPTSAPSPPAPSISRGATARSAVSPRVSSSLKPTARRASIKGPSQSPSPSEGQSDLSDQLKHETEQKEQLLVQVQDKDQLVATLGAENDQLTSALNAAESRLNDLYAEQSRSEMELAQRIDISEKLRAQVRELEKEKRDLQRRYNEQTTTFEAERQAFYDNEQHLKSRIQSLSQARRQPEPSVSISDVASIAESVTDVEEASISGSRPQTPKQDLNDPDQEPAEMTSLRLELSTLSTSYSSLQSTLVLLQTQLVDLKRVNHELQEENESYMILLRERTLSGRFDINRQVGGGSSDEEEDNESAEAGSLRSTTRSTLERVDEEVPEGSLGQELESSLEPQDSDSISSHPGRKRHGRNRGGSLSPGNGPRGESLADLPITGPGLDLAAELGRAENKDILEGNSIDDRDAQTKPKSKKDSDRKGGVIDGIEPSASSSDLDALRTEVKALKDANKALSLYASKIIDRIISQEGFEHVLAADYEKQPETPSTAHPKSKTKARSQSVANTLKSPPTPVGSTTPTLGAPVPPPKAQRRSMSFDWRGFNLFSGAEKKPEPSLRPLTLTPGASPVTGARKLETQEDDEDRRERERLNATLKLMGLPQPQSPQLPPPVQKSVSSPGPSQTPSPSTATSRRFSLFGSRSVPTDNNSDTLSTRSTPSLGGEASPNLTREALEHAEAENTLAALDAHERTLSAELARGSGSGFTEIQPRSAGRRSRRSAGGSGSGSTVWSAGIEDD